MIDKNEFKKALYREKPVALLTGKIGDELENTFYNYEATTSVGLVKFSIPAKEMLNESGVNIIGSKPNSQLLIRWMI